MEILRIIYLFLLFAVLLPAGAGLSQESAKLRGFTSQEGLINDTGDRYEHGTRKSCSDRPGGLAHSNRLADCSNGGQDSAAS